jgi:hypothetical protein
MAEILNRALAQVKREWKSLVSEGCILAACRAVNYKWRQREFGPVETVQLFLLQVLNQNTALTHLSHLCGRYVNAPAFCDARQRLPLSVLEHLQESVGAKLRRSTETLWHGLRVWLVDGSSFSMPDTPELAQHFGYPGNQRAGCGFPVGSTLMLMDMPTGLCRRAQAMPLNENNLPQMPLIHTLLQPGDVIVGDREFSSYAHLAVMQRRGIHAVFRVHGSQRVSFTPHRQSDSWQVRRARRRRRKVARQLRKKGPRRARKLPPTSKWLTALGHDDQLVAWRKPPERPQWLSREEYAALPDELTVREVRYKLPVGKSRVRIVILVTTLFDAHAFPPAELQKLYGWRWQIETNFKHLKTTMKLDVLKCHKVAGVCKELAVIVLIYNLVRAIMHVAAQRRDLPVQNISFADTLRWLGSGGLVPLDRLIANPHRPNRFEPRVRKRRPKPYPLMTRPRKQLRKRVPRKKL